MTKSTKCPHCSAPIHLPEGDNWAPIKCNFCGLVVAISDYASPVKSNELSFERVEQVSPVERVENEETAAVVEQPREELPTSEAVSTPTVLSEPTAEPVPATRVEHVEPEPVMVAAIPEVPAAAPQRSVPEPVSPVVERPAPPMPSELKEQRRGRETVPVPAPVSTTMPVVSQADATSADFTPDAYDAEDKDAPSIWNTVVMVACIALVILSVVLAVVLVYNS